ncbi:hypothetical protein HQ489_03395 [Candidatus Woesearchaeota archaeon]|nr:hypothetical protein [Candidatus Woesearchaeota archaeon]
MVQLLHLLDLHPERSAIVLCGDPFNDDYLDNGFYNIGSGIAAYHWRHEGKIQNQRKVHDSPRLVEFGIYATPTTLDEPLLKLEYGILKERGIYKVNDFFSRIMSDIFSTKPLKNCHHEVLNHILNRRAVGAEILNEYREQCVNDDHPLHNYLNNYEPKPQARVIPLKISI